MVRGGRREEVSGWGTRVYLWRIHVGIWQNQYNTVKLKNKIKKKLKKKEKKWIDQLLIHVKFLKNNPIDYSPPGSSVHGILQARIYTLLQGIFPTQG